MEIRFIIPVDANPDEVAWEHRPETWRELALQVGDDVVIDNLGSQWCVDNHIDGLGFCTQNSGPFEFIEVGA